MAVELLVLLAIWFTNIAYICHYAGIVSNPDRLREAVLVQPRDFQDFIKYYSTAELARNGAGETVWDLEAQKQWRIKYLSQSIPLERVRAKVEFEAREYTPQFVAIMIPWTFLPLHISLMLWLAFNLAGLMIPITVLHLKHGTLRGRHLVLWWALALGSGPCWLNFALGQSGTLMAGLLATFLLCWKAERDICAGVAMSLMAIIKPHQALVPLIMAVSRKRWQIVASFAICSCALVALAAAVFGIPVLLHYPQHLAATFQAMDSGQIPMTQANYINIAYELSAIMGPHTARLVSGLLAIPAAAAVYMLWRKIGSRNSAEVLGFGLCFGLLLFYLFNARCLYYDLLLLLVPWAVTVPVVEFERIRTIASRNLRFWCWLFVLFPVLNWVIIWSRVVDGGPAHQPILLLLLFIAWLNLKELLQRNETDTQPSSA